MKPSLPESAPNFRDPATCVRLAPQACVSYETDGWVTLHHEKGEKDIRIQSDILLILYPLTQWTTVGTLCKDWPQGDQVLIQNHLAMMYESGIIVTTEAEWEAIANPEQVPILNDIIINVENHHGMLQDSIRMACYRQAIQKAVTPQSVVMDLGSGTGILSFFAAQAGAHKIYAIEKRADMARLSGEMAKANGFDQIEVLNKRSDEIRPDQLSPKPDVLVAEILGDAILGESVLEYTIDARDRLLAPGAILIPCALDILLVAFDAGEAVDRGQEVTELEAIYGLKFDLLKSVLGQKATMRLERFRPIAVPIMSNPTEVIRLDLRTVTESTFKAPFILTATRDGFINGFCVYFRAHMDAETVLTNSPWAPPTHWMHAVFYFPQRRKVTHGQILGMEMTYKNGLGLWFTDADTD